MNISKLSLVQQRCSVLHDTVVQEGYDRDDTTVAQNNSLGIKWDGVALCRSCCCTVVFSSTFHCLCSWMRMGAGDGNVIFSTFEIVSLPGASTLLACITSPSYSCRPLREPGQLLPSVKLYARSVFF